MLNVFFITTNIKDFNVPQQANNVTAGFKRRAVRTIVEAEGTTVGDFGII